MILEGPSKIGDSQRELRDEHYRIARVVVGGRLATSSGCLP